VHVASGKIIAGRVVVDADLPEESVVTLIALDGEETFQVDSALEAVLLESIAQGRRGEVISAEVLLDELRRRE
jgi:hypothetical protein